MVVCISTDLTMNSERVHLSGTAWRYVRASMSLVNFLPPLCDTDEDGIAHYLVYT
jgi:lysophospholipid hydrolase